MDGKEKNETVESVPKANLNSITKIVVVADLATASLPVLLFRFFHIFSFYR